MEDSDERRDNHGGSYTLGAEDKRHWILSLGCDEVIPALSERGYMVRDERSWQQLIRRKDLGELRALLLHTKVEGPGFFEIALPAFCEQWPQIDVFVWSPGASPSFEHTLCAAGAREVILEQHPTALVRQVSDVVPVPKAPAQPQPKGPERRPMSSVGSPKRPSGQLAPAQGNNKTQFGAMRSRSPKMWDLFRSCERVAGTDATVLILGETGTGKELMARAIHENSGRQGPFVVLNCGAVPENLIDSELFGHVKGAFTGADHNKMGMFRHADGGTILLDEIGNVPLEVQFRLLRVLQEGAVRPVGGPTEIPVDVRVIAATNAPLEAMIRKGQFREDLYYRLNVIPVILPSLRERPEDIFFLFAHFLRQQAEQYGMERPTVSDDFLDQLQQYPWPGNVRQLENFTERLLLTHMGGSLRAADFVRMMRGFAGKDEFGRQTNVQPAPAFGSQPQAAPLGPAPTAPSQHYPPAPVRQDVVSPLPASPDPGTVQMPAMGSSVVQPAAAMGSAQPQVTRQQEYQWGTAAHGASAPTNGASAAAAPAVQPIAAPAPAPMPSAAPASFEPQMVREIRGQLLSEGAATGAADAFVDAEASEGGLAIRFSIDTERSLADNVNEVIEELEKKYIHACMEHFRGRVIKTAEHAGINRRTLLRKLKKYGIDKHDYRGT